MLTLIKELFNLLTTPQRAQLFKLQILMILMAFAEIAGVAAIGPFMALIGDTTILQGDSQLARLYQISNLKAPNDFIFWMGILALVILFISALTSIFTSWRLSLFASRIGIEIGDRLFSHYVHQPWLFHASGNSAQLTKKISVDSARVTNEIIQPLLMLNSKLVLTGFMSIAIFVLNPIVASIGLLVFFTAYLILYKVIKQKLVQNGITLNQSMSQRFSIMSTSFGGIKDVLLLGRQDTFVSQFKKSGKAFSRSQSTNEVFGIVPRYFMELVAFGSIIFLVLYLIQVHDGHLSHILPILAIYALAGFKLLPAFQQIYTMITRIKGGLPAFESIKNDLLSSNNINSPAQPINNKRLTPKSNIAFKDVYFTYPNKQNPALSKFNLEIPVNKTVGIVGESGSGKSTAIDLLLGLIQLSSGSFNIDGKALTSANLRTWQNSLGLVPQSIFLSDASIRENIALGIPSTEINDDQVAVATQLAHLENTISSLPNGLETNVGERGVQLSGGQRQRIGIARALYNDADTLIFDEATSALDGITEKLIMDAINEFSGKKTIVMIAHRLSTVQKCDIIYLMEQGKVIDSGSFNTLMERSATFRKMALNS